MEDFRSNCPVHWDRSTHPSLLSCHSSIFASAVPASRPKSTDFLSFLSFSPDGSVLQTLTDQQKVNLFSLSGDLSHMYYYQSEGSQAAQQHSLELVKEAQFQMAHTVSDMAWHPSSLRLAATMRDHPIHLIVLSGKVEATYQGRNHLDELDHTQSLAFNCAGSKLYAGGDRRIRCFDVESSQEDSCWVTAAKGALFGQKGLVSCLAFNPDQSGCYSAGCFDGSVSIYAEHTEGSVLDICQLGYQVSQTLWSPCGRYLYIAGRKHDQIQCWDIRGTKKAVGSMRRSHGTQQRMTCALDPWGRHLSAGDDRGRLLVFDTNTFEVVHSISCGAHDSGSDEGVQAVNAVAYHPYAAVMAVGTGSRHLLVDDACSDSSDDEMVVNSTEDSGAEDMDAILAKKRKLLDSSSVAHTKIPRAGTEAIQSELQVWGLDFTPIAYVPPAAAAVEAVMEEGEMADASHAEEPVDEFGRQVPFSAEIAAENERMRT